MNIRIYTDGACSGNPGPGGWGACYVVDGCISHTKSGNDPDTTNNRMELLAVVEALSDPMIFRVHNNLKRVDVYSDSAYVVNCVKNGHLARWAKNGWKNRRLECVKHKDLWVELLCLLNKRGRKIHINKIKAHRGHHFNELADSLARLEVECVKSGDDCYSRPLQSVD